MRATERYETAWYAFQLHLKHNQKASYIPILKELHVTHLYDIHIYVHM